MENQLSKHDFLKKETWVNFTKRTVITADITEDGVTEVHHGFSKKTLSQEEFEEAISSKEEDPGDYILENFPADGTVSPDRLERMGIDDAYEYVKESMEEGDKISSWSHGDYDFGYQIALYRGYGPFLGESLAYETDDLGEALLSASITDGAANVVEADSPEADGLENADDWVYLDRSECGCPNVYLDISNAMIEKIR